MNESSLALLSFIVAPDFDLFKYMEHICLVSLWWSQICVESWFTVCGGCPQRGSGRGCTPPSSWGWHVLQSPKKRWCLLWMEKYHRLAAWLTPPPPPPPPEPVTVTRHKFPQETQDRELNCHQICAISRSADQWWWMKATLNAKKKKKKRKRFCGGVLWKWNSCGWLMRWVTVAVVFCSS